MTPNSGSSHRQGQTANSSAGLPTAFLDGSAWKQLKSGHSNRDIGEAWLKLQCALIPTVTQAVIVLGSGEQGPFSPAANWPHDTSPSPELIQLAEIGMAERRSIARQDEPNACCYLAVPLLFHGELHGVAALQTRHQEQDRLSASLRMLEWGVAQVQVALEKQINGQGESLEQQLRRILAHSVACLEGGDLAATESILVHRLQSEFQADRVMLGEYDGEKVRVTSLSGASQVNLKANIVQQVCAAMTEAVDQSRAVMFPALEAARPAINRTHEELALGQGYPGICTVLVRNEGQVAGALTLEREDPFTADEVLQLEQIAAMCGPILELKRLTDRSVAAVVRDRAKSFIRALLGPRHAALKFSSLALGLVILSLTLIQAQYRVRAPAVLEGELERVVTAPFNSYVRSAAARPGDRVLEGTEIASLEVKETRLELTRWLSQRAQSERQYLESIALKERAAVQIHKAQVDQADAQIALLNEQIKRSKVTAPFTGLVVSGDLSRSIGEPVERGQVLFKLAPEDGYRIALSVDERDITQLKAGLQGELVLASRPGETLEFLVRRITPVAAASDGVNSFRVEAGLLSPGEGLRPGMTGTGKIEVGERSLGWIWTHRLFEWLRLVIWRWMP